MPALQEWGDYVQVHTAFLPSRTVKQQLFGIFLDSIHNKILFKLFRIFTPISSTIELERIRLSIGMSCHSHRQLLCWLIVYCIAGYFQGGIVNELGYSKFLRGIFHISSRALILISILANILWAKFLWMAIIDLWNSWKFLCSKNCYTVCVCHHM